MSATHYPAFDLTGKTPASTYENLVQSNASASSLVTGDGYELTYINITASMANSASWAPPTGTQASASWANFAVSSSHATSASWAPGSSNSSVSSSWASQSLSASYSPNLFPDIVDDGSGNVSVSGSIGDSTTYNYLLSTNGSSSWINGLGGTLIINGNTTNNLYTLDLQAGMGGLATIGNTYGDLLLRGTSLNATHSISSSYALSASYAPGSPSISSSYALTSSYAMNGGGGSGTTLTTASTYQITASRSVTASFAQNAYSVAPIFYNSDNSQYYGLTVQGATNSESIQINGIAFNSQSGVFSNISTSYAQTASYAMNGGGGGTSLTTGSTYSITSSNSITSSFATNAYAVAPVFFNSDTNGYYGLTVQGSLTNEFIKINTVTFNSQSGVFSNVSASYAPTVGLTTTKSWVDSGTHTTQSMYINSGLIVSWSVA